MKVKDFFPKDFLIYSAIIIIITSIFMFTLFGVTGIRIVFGLLVMWLPFYLILSNFDLSKSEIYMFSILLGLTLYSSIVFLFGLLISFRLSMVIVFILLSVIAYAISIYLNRKKK